MTGLREQTEQSRKIVQDLYDAAIAGDMDGVLERVADDLVVREPAFLPYGGTFHGKEGFTELLGKIARTYDMTSIKADYLVADGDRVIGVLRMPDLATGKDVLLAEQSTIRHGKVAEMLIFFHDAQSLITAPTL